MSNDEKNINIELEQSVQRRNSQLEYANARLRKSLRKNTQITLALQRNEARLRLINDTIPIQIGYVDKNEMYQYANKGYSDWFGNPPGYANGRTIPEVIGEDVYEQVKDKVKQALSGNQVSYEYRFKSKNNNDDDDDDDENEDNKNPENDFHFAHSTLVPEFGANGEVLGFFVFSYDITEQRRLQSALIQAQKMEAIGQLTGGLAHDFNNLLTVIIGSLVSLKDHYPNEPFVDDYINPALRSARRGVDLIRRLLTFSRKQELSSQKVNVKRLIADMKHLIRRSLPETIDIFYSTNTQEELYVLADPGQLESALLNFALNARDAMSENLINGGGKIEIVLSEQNFHENSAKLFDINAGNFVVIEVKDNGKGMSKEVLRKASEPFFTTKRLGLGNGLGLAMAKEFAMRSGGNLILESQENFGTNVKLLLPKTSAEDLQDFADLENSNGKNSFNIFNLSAEELKKNLILLVEDEENVRRVIRQQLTDLGFPVIEAENGVVALQILQHIKDIKIKIVISDILMPGGINGYQLVEKIQSDNLPIKFLLMSGYHDEQIALNAESLKLKNKILRKPFDKLELIKQLKLLLFNK